MISVKGVWDGLMGRRSVKLSGRDDAETMRLAMAGAVSASGKAVNSETVLSLSTAWSCIRLLSETIGTLPLPVYAKSGKDGSERRVARELTIYTLLHDSPNADQTAAEFLEGAVASLCLWGNFYAEKVMIGERLTALVPLRPDLMTVRRDEMNRREYRFSGPRGLRVLRADQVFHVKGFGVGGDVGLSPVSYARQTMGTALAADESAALFFASGLQLSGFAKEGAGGKSTPENRRELMALFDQFMGQRSAHKVMPLPAGWEFQGLTMNPEDAQLLETRVFHVEEICRWFRVPPFMVGHTEKSSSWGTGLEQQMIGFLTFSLRPYLTRIEQAIKQQLLTPVERLTLFAEFNLEGLLRADSAGRAALLSALGQNGYLTRNEGRALDNRPPLPGGDVLTVQSALVPLDQIGKAPSDGGTRAALQNWLGVDALAEQVTQLSAIRNPEE